MDLGLVDSDEISGNFTICPEWSSEGSIVSSTIDCGPDGVINITGARVASLLFPSLCAENQEDMIDLIMNDLSPQCKMDLSFSV